MLLLILRFWHLMFVYIFWLFFVLRGCEIKRLRYPLLAANFQNLIILYIMNWITMYPWFKLTVRKYLNQPYTVFNVNNRTLFLRVFFNDIKLYLLNLLESDLFFFKNYFRKDFFYFIEWNQTFYNQHIRKHYIKNVIVVNLKSNTNPLENNSLLGDNLFLIYALWAQFFNSLESFLVFINFNCIFDLFNFFFKNLINILAVLQYLLESVVYFFNYSLSFFLV